MSGQLRPGRIAVLYALFGAAWILLSDRIVLSSSVAGLNPATAQTVKGLLYVTVTALVVHWLVAKGGRASERARAWYQELFSIVPDAIFVTGPDGRFVDVNEVAVARYGYSRDELLQMGPVDLAPPDRAADVAPILDQGRQTDQRFEWWHCAKDGRIYEVEIASSPVELEGQRCILTTVRDLTPLRHAEAARSHSEEFQRAVVEASPVAIYSIDTKLQVLTWNHAAEELLGWTAAEAVGQPLRVVPEEHRESTAALLHKLHQGEALRGLEVIRQRMDGSRFDARISAAPIRSSEGDMIGYMVALEDISAQKQADAELRYRDRLLSEMGRIAKIGGWHFDVATGQGTWTDEVARIHELDPADATNVELGLSFYHGEHADRINEAIRAAIEDGVAYDLELQLLTADGQEKWVHTIGLPTIDDGRVTEVSGSFQDITERKQAEDRIEHLNRLLRSVRDVSQLIARERNRAAMIQQACDLLVEHRSLAGALIVLTDSERMPVTMAEATAGASFEPLHEKLEADCVPDCFPKAEQEDSTCLCLDPTCCCAELSVGGGMAATLSIRLAHDKVQYGFLVLAFEPEPPLDDEEQELLVELAADLAYALSVMADRDARERAEADRDELQRQLMQASKMEAVGQLAGGVAHDFNNILQAIMGYASLLIDEPGLSHSDREAVAEIRKGGERAATLTRQLLAFSRRQVMRPAALDVNQVVENLLKMLRRLIGEHIQLLWQPGGELGSVQADAGMLEQVIVNLCVNARDAMPDGGRLEIATGTTFLDADYCAIHPWAKPGHYVRLSVSDTGCGMDRQTLDRIFEPFFTTKGEAQGTGLGLATVYGIVKQHQGMINAYSEPAAGSTFKIYLPMSQQATQTVESPAEAAPSGGTETVLLAEDDEMVRRLATTILERAGYRVLSANDGAEALAVFEAHRDSIDMVVLDVVMPKMNGPEVFARLHETAPELPILFSSGYNEAAVHTNFVLNEGLTLLQKPYAPAALLRHVRGMIDRSRSQAEG